MTSIKLLASPAHSINRYKSTKSKLLKCCANIYFNKQCINRKITPKYAKIKVANTSPASQTTAKKAQLIRIKDEIKFLYKKKEKLNRKLYETHLQAAKEWGNTWHIICNSIQDTLDREAQRKYKSIDDKIHKLTQTQVKESRNHTQFYPRVKKETTITFSEEEMELLNKGLKYNLGHKKKSWISNLALEAENAIMSLPTSEQDGIRYQVAQNIQKLYTQQREKHAYPNWKITHERRVINQIRQKLITEEAMITKADKGNTIIVIYSNDYNKKVNNFIAENNFNLITNDITDKLQKEIRNAIRESTNLIPKDKRWQFVNLNPSIPNIRGLVKIHKTEAPIRPIVNWENSPAYKVAKMLTNKLHTHSTTIHLRHKKTPPNSSAT